MKRIIAAIIFATISAGFLSAPQVQAIEDPLSKPNNKYGMHILFPEELSEAASLINANGGEWGYVIIPIQAGDRDLVKWQKFMDESERLKVIPIIRLATHNDYKNSHFWRKPNAADVLDFANFLNSLHWPTKNRYIVVFNEVNRGDEWGGSANPKEYAELLSYAVTVFKSLNQDFFIIGGGFDNAAPNQGTKYIDQYTYISRMNDAVPGIFNQIDGYASHSYPNPGFSQPPTVRSSKSIASFSYERALIQQLSSKRLPIFITETGWTADRIHDSTRRRYYEQAFSTVWSDPDIVTVIPFLLKASGQFGQFSFIKDDGSHTQQYTYFKEVQKIKGQPTLAKRVLGTMNPEPTPDEIKRFTIVEKQSRFSVSEIMKATFGWIFDL